MIDINTYIKDLIHVIDQKSLKERILFLVASLVLVYAIWQLIVFDNINRLTDKISGSSNKIEKQIATLQGQISQVATNLSSDPTVKLQQDVNALEKENNDLQLKLDTMTETLVPPQVMTSLLKNILNESGLRIVSVRNLPVQPMFTAPVEQATKETSKVSDASSRFKVYKHAIEIYLEGNFKQVLEFIIRIERLPTKVSWEELEFKTINYPNASIKIIIGNISVNSKLLSTS